MPYVEEVLLLLSVDHIWYYVEISVISLLLNKDDETHKKNCKYFKYSKDLRGD